jgi:peptide chain release factor 3
MNDSNILSTRLIQERIKRRTFAIISHPDAGKTTLTEKLLLYAGMIRTAGMVHARKSQKKTSSDWMQMEQEKGISITASAMQFYYKDAVINVLDTPGHQDFSEDTYRTLTAADSAVMVIDAAKGVEPQTRKLFEVCKMRGIPILTFVNKMDLPGRDPMDLLAELEDVLGLETAPLYWPIGQGANFTGVVSLVDNKVLLFEKSQKGGAEAAIIKESTLNELFKGEKVDLDLLPTDFKDSLELIKEAATPFTMEGFLTGRLTPVFFGSALTNFGVEPFFDSFIKLAPCPAPRRITLKDGTIAKREPDDHRFSGYVFKVQANMDLKHRDSMAFIRVCSGEFSRDTVVKHDRLKKELRLSRSHNMFGGERQTVDSAYPGDIIGVVNPGAFSIGDTVSIEGGFAFDPLPKFPPEVVCRIRPKDSMKGKAFEKGMNQFRNEGAVLILDPIDKHVQGPLVAAVGLLQFEVLEFRLKTEYGVPTERDNMPYRHGCWVLGDASKVDKPSGSILAKDSDGQVIMLYSQKWEREHAAEKNPHLKFMDFLAMTVEA